MQSIKQRRFNFFDKELVKDPKDASKNFEELKNLTIKFSLSGRGLIIFGTANGSIVTLSRHLEVNSYTLFDVDMTCLVQFRNESILVAAGRESSNGQVPVIKILRVEKIDDPNMRPLTIVMANQGNKNITSLAVHETTNSLAVGMSSGEVFFFKSDILKFKNEKPRLIHDASHAITGLAFKTINKAILLYTATQHTIITINIIGKDRDDKINLSNDGGANLKCWAHNDKSQFVVARPNAVFVYEHDGLGPCYPFEGEKLSVHCFRGKLVIVAKENMGGAVGAASSSSSSSSSLSTSISASKAKSTFASLDMTQVSIYDIENRYVGFSGSFPHLVSVVCEWGSVFVLAAKGEQLFQLNEKDTKSKLDILFKKNLYQTAIDLAKSSQYDQEGVIDIIRQYADHLYSKGDFDKAIIQYVQTIGYLEPSYIIRKFLDAQRIVNLTDYLQKLHELKYANEDHTTLLVNCYTKLKDEARLNSFLMEQNIEFDLNTAIKVLRQSGYYKQAIDLCEKHKKHDDYLKIQLEHLKDYAQALNYIKKLEDASIIFNVKKYGKLLMLNIPDETVDFLKKLCSKYDVQRGKYAIDPTEFLHIFLKNSPKLAEFLEHVHQNHLSNSIVISNTLLELYIKAYSEAVKALRSAPASDGGSGSAALVAAEEKRALDFLRSKEAAYDTNLALTVCQLHNFQSGMLLLFEKNGMHQRILQYHMDKSDYARVLDTCVRYGAQDANLWVQALHYFSKKEEYNCNQYIAQILANIDKQNLLSPLMVIKILSRNSTLKVDTVKDYLLKRMRKEEKEIDEDTETINRNLKSIMELKSQIDHLKTDPIIFQANKCEYCREELNFPSIHCLCNHSFHADCFENHSVDDACPTCALENSNFMNLIKQNEESKKNLHDTFHKTLERSADKFEVIADYLGKGLFNKVNLINNKQ